MYQDSTGTGMATQYTNPQIPRYIINYDLLKRIGLQLLEAIGEDPTREGLEETPSRWADWWKEFIEYEPGDTDVTFETIETDQMVVVSGMRTWSLCEHHLLPFWCDISVGYIARQKVLGLSKFARIAHQFAHRLQIQERLVHQIADEVERLTGSPDVAILGIGQHLCMVMRGVKTDGIMKTSVVRGVFYDKPEARAEFFRLVGLT